MGRKRSIQRASRVSGRAVDDEDPDRSPMDDSKTAPGERYDVGEVERDRSKSSGRPKPSELPDDTGKKQ